MIAVLMTFDDLYVAVTLLAVVASIAALIGFSIDRWPEWRARNDTFFMDAQCRWSVWDMRWPEPAGTVQNPRDPSPSPRVRRLIDVGVRQQDRDAALRAQAEGDQQW